MLLYYRYNLLFHTIMTTREYFIQLTKEELPATLNCIRSVPPDNDSYAPNPKSRSARRIVSHIIGHSADLIEGIETGVINHRNELEFTDYNAAADIYEKETNHLLELIEKMDDKTWEEKQADFNVFGMKLYTKNIRDNCYHLHHDVLHHRGQLSTYYRSMGVANPVIYGATAETLEAMMAK